MTSRDQISETPPGAGGESIVGQAFPWLLRRKIAIPERVAGYVHRDEIESRAMPTRRRLTILKASGGFGKTTLLAECCRKLRRDGVATAWVSLDEQDEPAVLDTYIAFACHSTGLNLLVVSDPEGVSVGPESRVGVVLREIQAFDKPFVIAFDELERLSNPASVSLLEFLLQRGPPNLHLAFACRQIPDGLNVAGAVLDGRAELVGTEELRFSKAEVARFFDLKLSRGDLAAEMDRTAGWPIALRVSRNWMEGGVGQSTGVAREIVRNWVESRLFAGIGWDDRAFLLDVGLFDWMDAALLDEVLERPDSGHKLRSMRVLVGLLEPLSGGTAEVWRLHPLVREHCARQLFRENPRRFHAIHRRIAEALGRRGDTVAAMRHAVEAGEPFLAGELLERAGAVRLWIRQGIAQLQAADRWLSEDVISMRPRLALARCVVLLMAGRLDEARKLYGELAATRPARGEAERDGDFECAVDDGIVRGVMDLYGGGSISSARFRTLASDYARFARSRRLDPLTHGFMEYGLCVIHQLKAEFDPALKRLAGARQVLEQSPYMTMYGRLLRGQVAFAQGQVREAESHYRTAKRIAKNSYLLDAVSAPLAEVMLRELALERNRVSTAAALRNVPGMLMKYGVPFSSFATASCLAIELRLRGRRVDQALAMAEGLLNFVRDAGLTSLVRFLAALRVSVLVIAGRDGDAGRAWRLEGLPEDSKGCVDLTGQGWREMEAVSCARLRLLTAGGRFEEGRVLARELIAVSTERRLRRTLMRALALSVALEQHAGAPEPAAARLEEFLSLFAESPYAWPLVQERANCAAAVKRFLDLNPDSPHRNSARSLLAAMRRVEGVRGLLLSERERDVLRRLEGQRDKQIAAELGLTVSGVRFHLRKLFAKLDVRTRVEAVRRARELDLIPDDS